MPPPRSRKRKLMDEQIKLMRERGERLRQAAQSIGITHAAKAAGVPYTTLRDYMNGSEMKLSAVASLARVCGVTLDWLAYGVGETHLNQSPSRPAPQRGGHQIVIPWLDDREEGLRVGKGWLETTLTRPTIAALRLTDVTGDAMAPTLLHGDLVMIDTASTQVQGGALYALKVDETVMLRRLDLRLGGGIRVLADNDRYPPQDLSAEDIQSLKVIGEVVWFGGLPRG
ncbi:LexA family transcriptional regulator [Acetobacter senegalensis]|uniref:LexA family transcriptional regulator n=1 Tax=Acetobacter senegalensis TaxID=446692 RepID=UPI0038D2567B